MACVCIYPKEFSYIGFFASIFLEGVANVRGELRSGGDDNCLAWVNGAVEVIVGDVEPKLACACDMKVFVDFGTYALKVHVVDVECERYIAVDNAV